MDKVVWQKNKINKREKKKQIGAIYISDVEDWKGYQLLNL